MKKKMMQEPFLGYCPNYIVRRICIAILKLYCKKQERRLVGLELYCNRGVVLQ